MKKIFLSICLLFAAPWTLSQTTPATTQLDAHASEEVDNDELWVSLVVSRDGPNTHEITQAVLGQLQAASNQARKVNGVQLQVGQVSTSPIWNNKGKTNMWSAQAELILVSRNTQALAQLASDLTSLMRLNSTQFRLSKEKRLATEKALIQDMALNFKDKASSISKAFGFGAYTIKTLDFAPPPERGFPQPQALMARSASADTPSFSITNEGGKTTVSVGMRATLELLP